MSVSTVAAAAASQAAIAAANQRWYAGLIKPAFSPGPWLALAATAALAACMALAFFRVLSSPDYLPDRPAAVRAFLIGLSLDVLWTWLFFAGRHPTTALAASVALSATAAYAAWTCASVDRRAGLMLAPWVSATAFAFLLDGSVTLRNG